MGCTTNMISRLTSQYGNEEVLKYIMIQKATSIISEKFGGVRSQITNKFNSSIPFDINNVEKFDQIIKQVTDNQKKHLSELEGEKPRIHELDLLKENKPNDFTSFLEGAEEEYKSKIQKFKGGVLSKMKDELDFKDYMKGYDFDKYL